MRWKCALIILLVTVNLGINASGYTSQKIVKLVHAKERAVLKDTGDSADLEEVVEETIRTKALNSVILVLTQILRIRGIGIETKARNNTIAKDQQGTTCTHRWLII